MASPRQSAAVARCPRCGSGSLMHGHVAGRADALEVFACEDCRDYWFERDGARLPIEAVGRGNA